MYPPRACRRDAKVFVSNAIDELDAAMVNVKKENFERAAAQLRETIHQAQRALRLLEQAAEFEGVSESLAAITRGSR